MRTTVRIDESLLAEARKHAAETGRTLTTLTEDALREALARRSSGGKRQPVKLKTVKGSGVLPGIDLDDSAALLDAMP